MLLFKKKFLPAIRAGQKTQTIRLWKYRKMRPGQRSYIPGAGYIRLTKVEEVQLAALPTMTPGLTALKRPTNSAEKSCGFTPGSWPKVIGRFRIVFTLLPPEEQVKKSK